MSPRQIFSVTNNGVVRKWLSQPDPTNLDAPIPTLSTDQSLPPIEPYALNLQVSRIVSAIQETTLFTAITPQATIAAEAPTAQEPTVTVTQESESETSSASAFLSKIGIVEIGIAFGIFGKASQFMYQSPI